jgi:hypothetical protein
VTPGTLIDTAEAHDAISHCVVRVDLRSPWPDTSAGQYAREKEEDLETVSGSARPDRVSDPVLHMVMYFTASIAGILPNPRKLSTPVRPIVNSEGTLSYLVGASRLTLNTRPP